jgi:hypothetical protein
MCETDAIAWQLARHSRVCRSTAEIEYTAAGERANEQQYVHRLAPARIVTRFRRVEIRAANYKLQRNQHQNTANYSFLVTRSFRNETLTACELQANYSIDYTLSVTLNHWPTSHIPKALPALLVLNASLPPICVYNVSSSCCRAWSVAPLVIRFLVLP